ncbi:MAG: hypothetical protein ACI87E_002400 [Mariniblastus sp.]|jgi:hypothetical protein
MSGHHGKPGWDGFVHDQWISSIIPSRALMGIEQTGIGRTRLAKVGIENLTRHLQEIARGWVNDSDANDLELFLVLFLFTLPFRFSAVERFACVDQKFPAKSFSS